MERFGSFDRRSRCDGKLVKRCLSFQVYVVEAESLRLEVL